MTDVLWLIAALALGALMIWGAVSMEPHWASKDGERFTCRVQTITSDGRDGLGWREMRAFVQDGEVHLRARGLRGHAQSGRYQLLGAAPKEMKGRRLFLLSREEGRLVLRVPANSRAVPVLEALAAGPVNPPNPGSDAAEGPPGPG